MMKKALRLIPAAVLSGFLCLSAGCSSFPFFQKVEAEQPSAKAEAKTQKVGEELILAFMKNKPDLFIAQLPPKAQKEFTKQDFEVTRKSMIEKLGKPVSYEFITNLEHPIATISVWRIKFERESSDKKRLIHQETLFRAMSAKLDGKDMLLSFNFL